MLRIRDAQRQSPAPSAASVSPSRRWDAVLRCQDKVSAKTHLSARSEATEEPVSSVSGIRHGGRWAGCCHRTETQAVPQSLSPQPAKARRSHRRRLPRCSVTCLRGPFSGRLRFRRQHSTLCLIQGLWLGSPCLGVSPQSATGSAREMFCEGTRSSARY